MTARTTTTTITTLPLSKALSDFKFFSIASLILSIVNLFSSGLGLFSILGLFLSAASYQASNPLKANVRVLKLFSCCQLLNFVIAVVGFSLITAFIAPVLSCACSDICVNKAYTLLETQVNPWIKNQTIEHDVYHSSRRLLQVSTNKEEEEEESQFNLDKTVGSIHVHKHRMPSLALLGRFITEHTTPCVISESSFSHINNNAHPFVTQPLNNANPFDTPFDAPFNTPFNTPPIHIHRLRRVYSFPRLLLGRNEDEFNEDETESSDRHEIWRIVASTLMRPSVQVALHGFGRFISSPPPFRRWHEFDTEHTDYFSPPLSSPPDCRIIIMSSSSSSSLSRNELLPSPSPSSSPSSSPSPSTSPSPSPSSLPRFNPLSNNFLIQMNEWISNVAVQSWQFKSQETSSLDDYTTTTEHTNSKARLLKKISEEQEEEEKEEEEETKQHHHRSKKFSSKEITLGHWLVSKESSLLNLTLSEFTDAADAVCNKGWIYYSFACIPFIAWLVFLRFARVKALLLLKHPEYIAADRARRSRQIQRQESISSSSMNNTVPSTTSNANLAEQNTEPLYRFVQGVGFVMVSPSHSSSSSSSSSSSPSSSSPQDGQSEVSQTLPIQTIIPSAPPGLHTQTSLIEDPIHVQGGDLRNDVQDAIHSIFDPVREVFSRWNGQNNSYSRVQTVEQHTEDPNSSESSQQIQVRYTDSDNLSRQTRGPTNTSYPTFPTV